jgi:hypothetical protein
MSRDNSSWSELKRLWKKYMREKKNKKQYDDNVNIQIVPTRFSLPHVDDWLKDIGDSVTQNPSITWDPRAASANEPLISFSGMHKQNEDPLLFKSTTNPFDRSLEVVPRLQIEDYEQQLTSPRDSSVRTTCNARCKYSSFPVKIVTLSRAGRAEAIYCRIVVTVNNMDHIYENGRISHSRSIRR